MGASMVDFVVSTSLHEAQNYEPVLGRGLPIDVGHRLATARLAGPMLPAVPLLLPLTLAFFADRLAPGDSSLFALGDVVATFLDRTHDARFGHFLTKASQQAFL